MTKTDWTVEEVTVTEERDVMVRVTGVWGDGFHGKTSTIRIPREQVESLTGALTAVSLGVDFGDFADPFEND